MDITLFILLCKWKTLSSSRCLALRKVFNANILPSFVSPLILHPFQPPIVIPQHNSLPPLPGRYFLPFYSFFPLPDISLSIFLPLFYPFSLVLPFKTTPFFLFLLYSFFPHFSFLFPLLYFFLLLSLFPPFFF